MAKIYLNDLIYATSAGKPFIIVARRYINFEPIYNFLVKYMTMTFSMLPGLEKKKEDKDQPRGSSTRKGRKPALVGKAAEEARAKEEAEATAELQRRFKKSLIIEMLRKLQEIKNEDYNEMMRTICLLANKKNMDEFKRYNKGIIAIMNFWGNGKGLCDAYVEQEREKVRLEQERI